nr:helix-turn-helix domain-containing protein [Corynebacterium antarcticum]
MLTVSEVAVLSGISADTIRRMCVAGEIDAAQNRVNAPWRIHVRELTALRRRAA